ncbi:MAG: hypothetical protein KJ884_09270 [Gammaproteobacteria bacterium]|jgi:hypothetical protein|nr:hypothetical protein [Gammaproteobacteria bacterium]MBU1491677.1 hypothetical protein [Gammaproteobacteria bacterium]MBU2140736.1 hypothetical protein [Gammaproteobacteria bacterium]MBU2215659.1 hypothetical protein [Gammaproteobacteria bacterium]MBU2323145.1 hypothetical protein [Gammaproteobacteria bacterium]
MELNKAVLDCMKTLRRQLRDEQALDIRLSQPDAITSMLSACLSSSNEETRQLGMRLAQLSETPFSFEPSAPTPRMQAGHPLLVESAPVHHTGSVRIYRGQRVYA